jgi:hypothetical protein
MSKIALLVIGSTLLATLGACGDQGYSRTNSYGARVGSTGTAADAAANNGSTSTTMEAQRQKVDNYNGIQPGYR